MLLLETCTCMDEFITFNIFNFMPSNSKMQKKKINEHDFILCQHLSLWMYSFEFKYMKGSGQLEKSPLNWSFSQRAPFPWTLASLLRSHVCVRLRLCTAEGRGLSGAGTAPSSLPPRGLVFIFWSQINTHLGVLVCLISKTVCRVRNAVSTKNWTCQDW